MRKAKYEKFKEDGSYYGEIKGFDGIYANEASLKECRIELESALKDWIAFSNSRKLSLPVID